MEVELINAGQADHSQPVAAALHWREGLFVASDERQEMEMVNAGPRVVQFRSASELRRPEPAQRRKHGLGT